ncbi:uncharacterized protein N7496_008168, partial [Penicillium cataractarum]
TKIHILRWHQGRKNLNGLILKQREVRQPASRRVKFNIGPWVGDGNADSWALNTGNAEYVILPHYTDDSREYFPGNLVFPIGRCNMRDGAYPTLIFVRAAAILVFLSVLSWYTGFLMGQFKVRYPQVHSMADAGGIIWGPIGREIVGIGQLILLVFFRSSHILTFSILLNVLTGHATCSIVFRVVGLVISSLMALPRTMEKVFWFAITSFISIFTATVVLMVSVGVEAKFPIQNDTARKASFYKAFLAVTNIISLTVIAHVAYFGFISETKQPRDYPKSLAFLHIVETTLYLVSALVIYHFVGPNVKSPALSSAGPIMRKFCYGIAIPTVLIAGIIAGHVACKNIYIRLFRGSDHLHKRSVLSVGSWIGIALTLWVVAWVIAEFIPSFNDLLSLIVSRRLSYAPLFVAD